MRISEAIDLNQTAFPNTLRFATDVANVLKAGNNDKLGKNRTRFTRGPFRGMPLYSLTLEERATCDSECPLYEKCYGNHMPFAHRFIVNPGLLAAIEREVSILNVRYPKGFVVRLHVLGDFNSVAYVMFWQRLLGNYSALRVYGYTHQRWAIKAAINSTYRLYPDRFVIYQSDAKEGTTIRPRANTNDPSLPTCPNQTGKVKSCLDCGLCCNSRIRGVSWQIH